MIVRGEVVFVVVFYVFVVVFVGGKLFCIIVWFFEEGFEVVVK